MRAFFVAGLFLMTATAVAADYAPIPRVLPPPGIEIPAEQLAKMTKAVAELRSRLQAAKAEPQTEADIEVLLKAVAFAAELGEFYNAKDVAKAENLLKVARERLEQTENRQTPWKTSKGLVVRGFVSRVDGSVQPYGLVIPEDVDVTKREGRGVPLYIFLHGRGDKQTDLHFLEERLRSKGEVHPPGVIVLHPFGRQCVGYKSAGETDVLEAVQHACLHYPIDSQKIVLMGFSMGGAGAWHLGAHYADLWAVVAPGAGFAETARYTKSDPDKVPWYEQKLWGCYDAPASVRNLFNTKTIAYSGEKDKQIQAARVMEEAFQAEGKSLDHRIGPGVEHKYEPETLKKLLADIAEHLKSKNDRRPMPCEWQARTLRYGDNNDAGRVLSLEEHWIDARLTKIDDETFRTKNIRAFCILDPHAAKSRKDEWTVTIDGKTVTVPAGKEPIFRKGTTGWVAENFPPQNGLFKIYGLQGPIDDAFLEPFLIVTPSGQSPHADFAKWAKFEADHSVSRWTGLMRGKPRVKADREVTDEDLKQYHVVCWGDPESNTLLARMKDKLPVKFNADEFEMRGKKYARNGNAPVLIYPNPLSTKRYIVLNSGLTFREAHDKTNSQQNPKLPDWAVVDLSEPPSASAPGKIADAGFFDEEWRFKNEVNRGR